MEIALGLLVLVAVVCAGSALGRKLNISVPLLLVLAGVIGSFLPFVPDIELNPEVVLVGLLPPLLYAAALRTSLFDFRSNRRAIGLLSVGYVIFGTITVGLVVWWLFPEIPLAAAFALGAVLAHAGCRGCYLHRPEGGDAAQDCHHPGGRITGQ
ncbi:NhaP-type Na+/H+ or K+/H+ antiporter [Arthrobacter sp. W4I7]|nr:NhaP-type Na+/H+ or K+/H+ antiporter [Arthrobacter sp. W4I7]